MHITKAAVHKKEENNTQTNVRMATSLVILMAYTKRQFWLSKFVEFMVIHQIF